MNSKNFSRRPLPSMAAAAFIVAFTLAGAGCKESLPVYQDPQGVLSLRIAAVEQLDDHLAPPGRQAVRIVLQGTNLFDEPFLDSVRFDGTMKIIWERQPFRVKTYHLTKKDLSDPSMVINGRMLLVPGQSFSMEVLWNMRSDDGIYLPALMNFAWLTRRLCAPGIACADPETFIVQTSLNVYDRLGVLTAPPAEFTFVAHVNIP